MSRTTLSDSTVVGLLALIVCVTTLLLYSQSVVLTYLAARNKSCVLTVLLLQQIRRELVEVSMNSMGGFEREP